MDRRCPPLGQRNPHRNLGWWKRSRLPRSKRHTSPTTQNLNPFQRRHRFPQARPRRLARPLRKGRTRPLPQTSNDNDDRPLLGADVPLGSRPLRSPSRQYIHPTATERAARTRPHRPRVVRVHDAEVQTPVLPILESDHDLR